MQPLGSQHPMTATICHGRVEVQIVAQAGQFPKIDVLEEFRSEMDHEIANEN